MYKKSVMHVQSCCFVYKTYCFLTFSSPSASLDLKVPESLAAVVAPPDLNECKLMLAVLGTNSSNSPTRDSLARV